MLIYAGIDEAGYGPIFGPLVVARTVFAVSGPDPPGELPSLWNLLQSAVCKKITDKKNRIAVNDSKALYTPTLGLRHLERGVLGFLPSAGIRARRTGPLLGELAYDRESRGVDHPWYAAEAAGPGIPVHLPPDDLERARGRIERAGGRTGVRLVEARTAVVFEDRFNRLVNGTRSKSACEWTFVGGHLREIWERFGTHHPRVVIDRQGGRRYYRDLLEASFPGARVESLEESAPFSCYRLGEGARTMEVRIQVDSERHHLPAALASMTAKYVRELMMIRFQRFWRAHAPEVRPTFGYFGDGRRFLREIDPVLRRLGVDRELLVRCC